MKSTHRNYTEEKGDFYRLVRFFCPNPPQRRTHTTWCLGRLVDWKYGLYENKRIYAAFCNENAHLWFDGFGELAGFVLSESGDSGFQILTLPGYRFLFEEILLWVLENWGDRPAGTGSAFYTELTEYQSLEAGILEQYGFGEKSGFQTRRFDLTATLPAPVKLLQGFTIVDMKTHPDLSAQSVLRANAFEGKRELTEEELEFRLKFYDHSRNGPIYHPQTDLCVMAEDGRFVSGCEALINAKGLEADIERVCTHEDFRRSGFARAVIIECLHRLRGIGMRSVYITGYGPEAIYLYGSLGAMDEVRAFVYAARDAVGFPSRGMVPRVGKKNPPLSVR